jgi:hypothetical protein
LIDRQAAIDTLADMHCKSDEDGYVWIIRSDAWARIDALPSAQPEIIYCKDCVKHNKAHGYYFDGKVIGIMDCCPLTEIKGIAQGHEFDYQYCAYAERRTDG